ncbi:aminotransferase class V-fold PLP-dependent enzyme [Kineosporia sp. NBRC 101731]|uniref:aminotransferase class V-fold PLP-dependent enzyme n=1 Tax=Kineosporia sp. NBRC 101731 TaxID=3032199 RepID=UPI00249FB66E|nr:aminotransferase class V-fold PLP-dependent enzyme [Kineosporia sp. NBRC 101731]GLY28289.1 putative aminotransferase/cysteine desulfurase [Kineosporia sp. NBRC 101731]
MSASSSFRNTRYRQANLGVATPAGGISTFTPPESARASEPTTTESTLQITGPSTSTTTPPTAARLPIGPLLPVVGGNLAAPLAGNGTGGRTARAVNLDYAASAPALQAVADHVAEVLPYYASVHRGAGYASQVSTALYESARQTIGAFVGARPGDLTVFTRNTTDALNLLAGAVPQDGPGAGEVVVLDVEHHANLLPWTARRHRLIPTASTVAETVATLEATLAERPAALVAVTGCSNVTGEILPIGEIARIAHAHGARVVVDGAQLVPHRRVDIAALDVDYIAFSGHKIYAPFGSGVLIGRSDWLDAAQPHLAGGGAVRSVDAQGQAVWTTGVARHEGGTPNVLGAAALAAACRAIADLPEGAVEEHEAALSARLLDGLQAIPGVRVLRAWSDSTDRVGVVGFTVEGHEAARVAVYLSAEHGVGVRDGKFCAHPLLNRLGVTGGALRASLGLGSRSDDVERLLHAVRTLVTEGEKLQYEQIDGAWTPVNDDRPAPSWSTWGATNPVDGTSECGF